MEIGSAVLQWCRPKQTHRQTDRQTDTQTDTQTDRQKRISKMWFSFSAHSIIHVGMIYLKKIVNYNKFLAYRFIYIYIYIYIWIMKRIFYYNDCRMKLRDVVAYIFWYSLYSIQHRYRSRNEMLWSLHIHCRSLNNKYTPQHILVLN